MNFLKITARIVRPYSHEASFEMQVSKTEIKKKIISFGGKKRKVLQVTGGLSIWQSVIRNGPGLVEVCVQYVLKYAKENESKS